MAELEHVMDLSTGQGMDREFEGERPESTAAAEQAGQAVREAALSRLRWVAGELRGTDKQVLGEVISDLLTVMGLGE